MLDQQITELAAQGLSPYQIEERLNIPHYTVHIAHHQALMAGYAQEKPKERAAEDRKRERQKECDKRYYLAHKEKVKQRTAEYQKKNKDKVNARQRAYYHKKQAEKKALQAASVAYRQEALERLNKANQKETNND